MNRLTPAQAEALTGARLSRRSFGTGVACGVLAWGSKRAFAQSFAVLGYAAARNANPKRLQVFKQGLAELGHTEGNNIRIDYREAVLDAEYQAVIADLIAKPVDMLIAANVAATAAAARATSTIPIVMLAVFDPVGIGVVKSLERPGTNVTGTTMYAPQLIGERLRLLHQLVPGLDRVGMVFNGNNGNNIGQVEVLRREAGQLGIKIKPLDIRTPEAVEPAFAEAMAFGTRGMTNAVDTFINSRRFALAEQAARHRQPFVFTDTEYVEAGGLLALGPGHVEGYHDAARYVDRILHGAKPADLPIAGPTHFSLSANRKALAQLGISLPQDIMSRVDEWFD